MEKNGREGKGRGKKTSARGRRVVTDCAVVAVFAVQSLSLVLSLVLSPCFFLVVSCTVLVRCSVLLFVLCLVCSVEISRYSHRFRTVLTTLGAVNQISTEGQVGWRDNGTI